jgi:hypothetical protein
MELLTEDEKKRFAKLVADGNPKAVATNKKFREKVAEALTEEHPERCLTIIDETVAAIKEVIKE